VGESKDVTFEKGTETTAYVSGDARIGESRTGPPSRQTVRRIRSAVPGRRGYERRHRSQMQKARLSEEIPYLSKIGTSTTNFNTALKPHRVEGSWRERQTSSTAMVQEIRSPLTGAAALILVPSERDENPTVRMADRVWGAAIGVRCRSGAPKWESALNLHPSLGRPGARRLPALRHIKCARMRAAGEIARLALGRTPQRQPHGIRTPGGRAIA